MTSDLEWPKRCHRFRGHQLCGSLAKEQQLSMWLQCTWSASSSLRAVLNITNKTVRMKWDDRLRWCCTCSRKPCSQTGDACVPGWWISKRLQCSSSINRRDHGEAHKRLRAAAIGAKLAEISAGAHRNVVIIYELQSLLGWIHWQSEQRLLINTMIMKSVDPISFNRICFGHAYTHAHTNSQTHTSRRYIYYIASVYF